MQNKDDLKICAGFRLHLHRIASKKKQMRGGFCAGRKCRAGGNGGLLRRCFVRKRRSLALRELGARLCAFVAGRYARSEFFLTRPLPPVWHTSIFDCEGLKGGPHTFSIPRPYHMHTSIPCMQISAERTARRTVWLGSSMERLCAERRNNRQTWRKFFASAFRGLRRKCAGWA